jgi:isopentenyl phosphate kinase
MYKQIIENITSKIAELEVFETIHGLTHMVEEYVTDKETGEITDTVMVYPACYISNGQFMNVDFDQMKNTCYIRRNGQVSISENEDYERGDEYSQILTQPFKLVCLIYNQDVDDEYRDEKQIANIINSIQEIDNRQICAEMSIDSIRTRNTGWNVNRYEVVRGEFQNVAIEIPFESLIVSVDFEVVMEISKDCWSNFLIKC